MALLLIMFTSLSIRSYPYIASYSLIYPLKSRIGEIRKKYITSRNLHKTNTYIPNILTYHMYRLKSSSEVFLFPSTPGRPPVR